MNTKELPHVAAAGPARSLLTGINRGDGRKCAAQHFGAWAIEPKWLRAATDAIRNGTWKPRADIDDDDLAEGGEALPLYEVNDGVAIVSIDGQMTKRGSSFGGCSTIAVRDALRTAAADARVTSIVLHICSPGGTCAGTGDLADDVNAIKAGKFGPAKPIIAYIADMGCSAAYWVASQCDAIYANATAIIGSIGTYTVLEDDTGAQEKLGVKYRIVSTGLYKGLGADGAITDPLVADVQREVDELNAVFLAAVQTGRGDKIADIAKVADGRAWGATVAQQLGLIDFVCSLDDAISQEKRAAMATSQMDQLAAAIGRDGKPAPKAGKIVVAKPGDERIPMDPKKRAYLESVGLKTDATDEDANTFYGLLSPEKQAAADAAETAEDAAKTDPVAPAPAATATVVTANDPKAELKALIVACDGDAAYAATAFGEGFTPDQAKAAYAAVKSAKAETAAVTAKLARAEFEAKGPKPIGLNSPAPKASVPDAPESDDPGVKKAWAEAKAGEIWDTDPDSHKGYSTKDRFIAIRSRELLGHHKVLSKSAAK